MRKALDSQAALRLMREVQDAAVLLEGRWTMGALARVDPALAELLREQIEDYQEARITGTMHEFKTQAKGAVRGYLKAVRVMEESGFEHDAYLLGLDPNTGSRVAIGDKRASARYVAAIHGDRVTWLTADEVAKLWASIAGLRRVDAIKEIWPEAEVVDFRPHTRGWPTGPHSGNWPSVAEVMPAHPEEEEAEDE